MVEFRVMPTTTAPYQNRAYDIRRPGGGLITFENKDGGGYRRLLGIMYTELDEKAILPPDLHRISGWICEWRDDQLSGFLCSYDRPHERIFFHLDDCHIRGHRKMRVQQDVQFSRTKVAGQPFDRAIHITGPETGVLQYELPNHAALNFTRTLQLSANTGERHIGIVAFVSRGESKKDLFGFICPDEKDAKTAYFSRGDLRVTDVHDIADDSRVEFELQTNPENPDRLRATNITGPNGRLLTNWRGAVGDYYRGRGIRHGTSKAAPVGQKLTGFICMALSIKRIGLIEATPPNGAAFDRINFSFDDLVPDNDTDPKDMGVWIGSFVQFEVEAGAEEPPPTDGPIREPKRWARKVQSVGKQFYDPNMTFNFELLRILNNEERSRIT